MLKTQMKRTHARKNPGIGDARAPCLGRVFACVVGFKTLLGKL